jgi:hypothetical protein
MRMTMKSVMVFSAAVLTLTLTGCTGTGYHRWISIVWD